MRKDHPGRVSAVQMSDCFSSLDPERGAAVDYLYLVITDHPTFNKTKVGMSANDLRSGP
ncbi:hypothetical protein D3C84_980270 [compost metagenome]